MINMILEVPSGVGGGAFSEGGGGGESLGGINYLK